MGSLAISWPVRAGVFGLIGAVTALLQTEFMSLLPFRAHLFLLVLMIWTPIAFPVVLQSSGRMTAARAGISRALICCWIGFIGVFGFRIFETEVLW